MKKLILMLACVVIASPAPDSEKEVLGALGLWRHAVMKKDRAAFEKVLHNDLSYRHSSGLVENKAQAIEHILGGSTVYEVVDFKDTTVRIHGSAALVTGKVDYVHNTNGKRATINLSVLTVWIKGPQGWQMIGRQSTRPGQ